MKIIVVLMLGLTISAPMAVSAAGLVPCGGYEYKDGKPVYKDGKPVKEPACTLCDLWKMISDLMFFIIFKVAFPIAGLLFVYAGILFLFAGAKPGNVETAKSIFFNVIIGLCIILLAWLTVDTLIKTLVPKEGNEARTILWSWNKFPPCK